MDEDVSIEIKTGSYWKYDSDAIAVHGPVRERLVEMQRVDIAEEK
ncbi:MAG: hypothetical protein ACLUR5_15950 [Eubacterium ventriosum]